MRDKLEKRDSATAIELLEDLAFYKIEDPDGEDLAARMIARIEALEDRHWKIELEALPSAELSEDIESAGDFISEHHMGERGAYAFDPCRSCKSANTMIRLASEILKARSLKIESIESAIDYISAAEGEALAAGDYSEAESMSAELAAHTAELDRLYKL